MDTYTKDIDIEGNDLCINDDNIYNLDNYNDDIERTNQLPAMEKTVWFKKICNYPVNITEMKYFIKLMDLLDIFKNFKVESVLNFTPKKLDCLFITLKAINITVVKFCEHVVLQIFRPEFEKILYQSFDMESTDPAKLPHKNCKNRSESVRVFLEEFYVDLTSHFANFAKSYKLDNDNNRFQRTVNKMVSYCRRLLRCEYYYDVIEKLNVPINSDFFKNNYEVFRETTRQIIDYADKSMTRFKEILENIANFFMNENTDEENLQLYINSSIDVINIVNEPSDAIDSINFFLFDSLTEEEISEKQTTKIDNYENIVFSRNHRRKNKKYAFWNKKYDDFDDYKYWENFGLNRRRKIMEEKINALGLTIYPKIAMNSILEPFIINNLVKNTSELVSMIISVMESYKNEPYIFSKYDQIDLETAYLLVSLGNDEDNRYVSYDDFLLDIKEKHDLPIFYPTEFILRLVGRILNVRINFYEHDLTCTEFDNTIHGLFDNPITIYQYNICEFFVLYSSNTEFIPLLCDNSQLIMDNTKIHHAILNEIDKNSDICNDSNISEKVAKINYNKKTVNIPSHGDIIIINNRKVKVYEI